MDFLENDLQNGVRYIFHLRPTPQNPNNSIERTFLEYIGNDRISVFNGHCSETYSLNDIDYIEETKPLQKGSFKKRRITRKKKRISRKKRKSAKRRRTYKR